jgi:hypothetical protein
MIKLSRMTPRRRNPDRNPGAQRALTEFTSVATL